MSLSPEWHDLCERHLSVKVTLQGTQLLPVRVAGPELSPVGRGTRAPLTGGASVSATIKKCSLLMS